LYVPRRRVTWAVLAVALAVSTGCERPGERRLVVATSWPESDRQRIASDFAGWLGANPGQPAGGQVAIDWWILEPGDDLVRLVDRRESPDLILGGSRRDFERLARADRLADSPAGGSPPWAVMSRGTIRVGTAPDGGAGEKPADEPGEVAFDDPRNDPVSLAWAEAQLGSSGFADGYARLVRAAGVRRRIGSRQGSAAAALERGEAPRALVVTLDRPAADEPGSIAWLEGVGIPRQARHRQEAEDFVRFLAAREPPDRPPGRQGPPLEVSELIADLLGATLVDAQDELRDAWTALGRNGPAARGLRWMTEAPPWPPASVARILGDRSEAAMAMVETLAGQVAPDAETRAWLVRSWLSPTRTIDGKLLDELTRAAGGKLFRERRFREWLRAEWTAWARQRYRRVLRVVAAARP
jgi:hypothetical protein